MDTRYARHVSVMKAYALFPKTDVFDGSGVLSSDARRALDLIAELVVGSLTNGSDFTHVAATWEGESAAPPSLIALADQGSLTEHVRRCLDPNDPFGGDIRSASNCRMVTFGYDSQAFICLRHEDALPVSPDTKLVVVEEHPEWLVETDWFDGPWPFTE